MKRETARAPTFRRALLDGEVISHVASVSEQEIESIWQAAVQRDVDEGARLGITATPTFFINGRLLSGAQLLESFVRVIEDELARTR